MTFKSVHILRKIIFFGRCDETYIFALNAFLAKTVREVINQIYRIKAVGLSVVEARTKPTPASDIPTYRRSVSTVTLRSPCHAFRTDNTDWLQSRNHFFNSVRAQSGTRGGSTKWRELKIRPPQRRAAPTTKPNLQLCHTAVQKSCAHPHIFTQRGPASLSSLSRACVCLVFEMLLVRVSDHAERMRIRVRRSSHGIKVLGRKPGHRAVLFDGCPFPAVGKVFVEQFLVGERYESPGTLLGGFEGRSLLLRLPATTHDQYPLKLQQRNRKVLFPHLAQFKTPSRNALTDFPPLLSPTHPPCSLYI